MNTPLNDRQAGAEALVRATLSLGDADLRACHVATLARAWPPAALARALDALCERAEQAEADAREALVAVVEALHGDGLVEIVEELRRLALDESLLALDRLIRLGSRPGPAVEPGSVDVPAAPDASIRGGVPSRAAPSRDGRTLTLGERKWLARRPDRDTLQRLLGDPHPDVIRRCLANSRVTEDDVLRLTAKRPGRAEVLAEIARSSWSRRPRIRIALVLNPATPLEIAMRCSGLLLRPELDLVARSPGVSAPIRALCLEYLERRPPSTSRPTSGGVH